MRSLTKPTSPLMDHGDGGKEHSQSTVAYGTTRFYYRVDTISLGTRIPRPGQTNPMDIGPRSNENVSNPDLEKTPSLIQLPR